MYVFQLNFKNQAGKRMWIVTYRWKDNFMYFANALFSFVRCYYKESFNREQQLGFSTKSQFRIISKHQRHAL